MNKYTCIALAGVATEYLLFGLAEGGIGDVQQVLSLKTYKNNLRKSYLSGVCISFSCNPLLAIKSDNFGSDWMVTVENKTIL